MRRSVVCILLAACAMPQAHAWKTTVYWWVISLNQSVHKPQTIRALELLRTKHPGNSTEWMWAKDVLVAGTGDLQGDANSHGNLIFDDERLDPQGNKTPDIFTATDFDSGPFYRFWIRAVEANGLSNSDVPSPRVPGSRRSPLATYRYFAYMAHLAQDQCAPSHAANIRHGPWDGVEWWHWMNGGKGATEPLAAEYLVPWLDELGWNTSFEFCSYWNEDRKWDSDRGAVEIGNIHGQYWNINAFIEKVITNTQDRWMPGLSDRLDLDRYFESFDEGGHTLSDYEDRQIWLQEDRRNVEGYSPNLAPWAAFTTPLSEVGLLKEFYIKRPQYRPIGDVALPGQVMVGNDLLECGKAGWDPVGTWRELNKGCAPWLPHPDNRGEAFDRRWGTYGGAWGFPGRVSIEGSYSKENLIYAWRPLLSSPGARITPGDIYLAHTEDPYLPNNRQEKCDSFIVNDTVYRTCNTGYWDERAYMPFAPSSPGMENVGIEQINKATMWTAILLENLSRALPPRIVDFQVYNRMTATNFDPTDMEGKKPAWIGNSGAWLDLTLSFNRSDEYMLEFYAVPQGWFRNAKNPNRWRRSIRLANSPGLNGAIWPSDLTVHDLNGDVDPQGKPGAAGDTPNSNSTVARTYDFTYDNMPVVPLHMEPGRLSISERNMDRSDAVSGTVTPYVINASDLTQNTYGENGAPWYFNKTFTWTGQVGDPRGVFDPKIPEGSGKSSDYVMVDKSGKRLLKPGCYFLLVVAYRKYWRNAFARNQFKALMPDKAALEMSTWWSSAWDEDFFEICRKNRLAGGKVDTMIPDELIPFRFEPEVPKVLSR